jgi:hypothetical protein
MARFVLLALFASAFAAIGSAAPVPCKENATATAATNTGVTEAATNATSTGATQASGQTSFQELE